MTPEENLRDELLRQDGSASAGAATPIVDRITLRERRRMRWWMIVTVAAWCLTALYFLALLWTYAVLIHPVLNEFLTNAEYRQTDLHHHTRTMVICLKALLLWPALLLVAAGCTTAFTMASRRATLRQIQASLELIADRLKELSPHG